MYTFLYNLFFIHRLLLPYLLIHTFLNVIHIHIYIL